MELPGRNGPLRLCFVDTRYQQARKGWCTHIVTGQHMSHDGWHHGYTAPSMAGAKRRNKATISAGNPRYRCQQVTLACCYLPSYHTTTPGQTRSWWEVQPHHIKSGKPIATMVCADQHTRTALDQPTACNKIMPACDPGSSQ